MSTTVSLTRLLLRVELEPLLWGRTGSSLSCRVEDREKEGSGDSLNAPQTDSHQSSSISPMPQSPLCQVLELLVLEVVWSSAVRTCLRLAQTFPSAAQAASGWLSHFPLFIPFPSSTVLSPSLRQSLPVSCCLYSCVFVPLSPDPFCYLEGGGK